MTEHGIVAGGMWWMDYYAGVHGPSVIGDGEYETLRQMTKSSPAITGSSSVSSVAAWSTIVSKSIAAFFYLASCQMGFFAMP